MSGIAGFADWRAAAVTAGAARARVEAMCNAVGHRGAARQDFYVHGNAALGVGQGESATGAGETGRMGAQHESVTVIFDGEITNAAELDSELARLGYPYSGSPAHILIRGYQAWGDGIFDRLRGIFAIALWDERNQILLAARDRAGVKPFFYSSVADALFFGSESKCLMTQPGIDTRLDASAIEHYLAYLLPPRDRSVLRGIRKLLPGHYLKADRRGVTTHRYWEPCLTEAYHSSEDEAAGHLRSLLTHSLCRQIDSRSSRGILLSGGVNSSIVAAAASEASSRPVPTFFVRFGENDAPQANRARLVAQHLGTDHHEIAVEPDAATLLDRIFWHMDEPFGDPSAIANWYLSEAVASIETVFSGDGADELFGGCERYVSPSRVANFDRIAGKPGRYVAAAAWHLLPAKAPGRNFLRHVSLDRQGRYTNAMTCYGAHERRHLLSVDLLKAANRGSVEAEFSKPFERVNRLPWTAQMMAFDFETDLPDDVLTKIDRMGAAHSVDWRVPFLDDEIVEFAAQLPQTMKVRGDALKPVLKRTAMKSVPGELVGGPKHGFGMAVDRWFRGPVSDLFNDLLRSPTARQRGCFNNDAVDRMLHEHATGSRDHTMHLWQLVAFELWMRQHAAAPAMAA